MTISRTARVAPVLGLVVVAAVASFYTLGDRGFWGDEVWTVWWSQGQGWLQSIRRFSAPPDLPFSFLVTKLTLIAGENEFAARLPHALFAIGSVVTLYLIARDRLGEPTAIGGAAVLATAPLHVWYAQEARPYAALEFLSLVSIFLLLRLIERPTLPGVLAYGVVSALAIHNHLFGAFPVAVGLTYGLAVGAYRWRRGRREQATDLTRALIGAGAICLVGLAPVLPGIAGYLLAQTSEAGARFVPDLNFFNELLARFGAGFGWPLAAYVALAVVGTVFAVRRNPLLGSLMVALFVLPIAALSVAQPAHHFITRFFLFMLPFYLLAAVHGAVWVANWAAAFLARIRSRNESHGSASLAVGLATLLIAALLVVQVPVTMAGYGLERGTDWSGICYYLREHVRPGDTIIGTAYHQGTMSWCFDGPRVVAVPRVNAYTPDDLHASGRPAWYVHIGNDDPDPALAQLGYLEIPQDQIQLPGTRQRADLPSYSYPRSEGPSRLFRGPPERPTAIIRFQEVDGGSVAEGWPDYASIAPRRSYFIPMALSAETSRSIRIRHLAGPSRETIVRTNGTEIGRLDSSGQTDTWTDSELSVPTDMPSEMLVELYADGSRPSVVSEIKLTVRTEVSE